MVQHGCQGRHRLRRRQDAGLVQRPMLFVRQGVPFSFCEFHLCTYGDEGKADPQLIPVAYVRPALYSCAAGSPPSVRAQLTLICFANRQYSDVSAVQLNASCEQGGSAGWQLIIQIIAGKCRDLIYKDESSDAATSVSGSRDERMSFDPLELSKLASLAKERVRLTRQRSVSKIPRPVRCVHQLCFIAQPAQKLTRQSTRLPG